MVAEILFAGGKRDSVEVLGGTVTDTTTAGRFDSSYADGAVQISVDAGSIFKHKLYTQSGGVLTPTTVEVGESFFLHFEVSGGNTTSSSDGGITLRDSSAHPWVLLNHAGTGVIAIYYNSGTGASPVWTKVGADVGRAPETRYIYDIELVLGSPHTLNFYVDGSLVRSTTFTQASLTEIADVHYRGLYRVGAGVTALSQIMATRDISTIGAKVKTSRATGAGANTGFSGTYADVNEAVGSDVSLQSGVTAGLKSTHAMGDVTVPSGFEIKSVFHWLRAKNGGTGPVNIRSVLRHGGTDYATADLSGIGLGFGPVGARYDADPVGTNWTATTWNAIEAGYEAAT